MFVSILLFAGLGKLLIFTIQKYPLTEKLREIHPFIRDGLDCDFCLGCWVYLFLAWVFGMNIFEGYLPYIPLITELLGGIVISFIMHLISIGWRDKFSIIVMGE